MTDIERARLIREAHSLLDTLEEQITFIVKTLRDSLKEAA